MTEIAKPGKSGTGMSLDKALSIIEAADGELKAIRTEHKMNLLKRSVTEEDIVGTAIYKIGGLAVASTCAGFYVSMLGIAGEEMIYVPGLLGIVSLLSAGYWPAKVLRFISPKKWRTYTEESELNAAYNHLTAEEFSSKEKEILGKTKKALKVANKALAQQEQEIVYALGEGFTIKSSQPVQASQWDKLRLETIKHQGIEAVGIRPKVKELTV